jgi:hypothetical protein
MDEGYSNNSELPRVGRWKVSEKMQPYEGKLIMRTSAVRMFFVHYVSQLESGFYSLKPVTISVQVRK